MDSEIEQSIHSTNSFVIKEHALQPYNVAMPTDTLGPMIAIRMQRLEIPVL